MATAARPGEQNAADSAQDNMYSQPQQTAIMAPPQKPETFMLSSEAQQRLPHDAQVALQQVDNLKYFLISAPVDWNPNQVIRRFLLPTGDYISCVLWCGQVPFPSN